MLVLWMMLSLGRSGRGSAWALFTLPISFCFRLCKGQLDLDVLPPSAPPATHRAVAPYQWPQFCWGSMGYSLLLSLGPG